MLDRAVRDYQHAEADLQRKNSTALYTTQERWDMVIAARNLLEELCAAP